MNSTIAATAQMLNVSRVQLLNVLEEHDIFHRNSDGQRLPKLKYIHMGYFDALLSGYNKGPCFRFCQKTTVTATGFEFLREFIKTLSEEEQHQLQPRWRRQAWPHLT